MRIVFIVTLLALINISKGFSQDKTGDDYININYLSSYNDKGLPDIVEKDEIDLAFLADIDKSLPEGQPVLYIDPNIQTSIILKESAEIYLAFMYKNSVHKNAIGFYTYDRTNPPDDPADIDFYTIVFPYIANNGEGGDIFSGYKVKLGKFKANTAIAWFIITDAWSGNGIAANRPIYYSNSKLNPETSNYRSHMILLNDTDREKYILGFEDDLRDVNCDNDFNDVVCYLDVFPYSAVESGNMALISSIRDNGNNTTNSNKVEIEQKITTTAEQVTPNDTAIDSVVTSTTDPVVNNSTVLENSHTVINNDKIKKSPCGDEGISYKHFSNIKATVTAQPSVNSKKTIMKRMLVGHIISTEQAGELISLYEEEDDQLDMAGILYEFVCNKLSYGDLRSFFTGSNLKKFDAFVDSGEEYAKESTKNATLSNELETKKPTMDVNANASCDKPIMNEKQMKRFINSIRSRSFATEKYMVVEQSVGYNCFTVSQVIETISLFVSEKDRLELAKYLYDYTIDNQHYNRLTGAFGLESSIIEFKKFLESKK